MVRYWAVKCGVCEETIQLQPVGDVDVAVPPLEPFVCKSCGASMLYGSDDTFIIEA
jgi:hypothetical protein